jgi:beta-mannanase
MHEMNGNWYSYSASRVSDGESKYRDVFRRGVNRINAAGGSNLRFVWCPYVRAPVWGGNPLRNFYPGDDVVDILSLDGYAGYPTSTPLTFNLVFDAAVDEISAIHASKPVWLCEWGMDAWDYSATEKEQFFDDALQSFKTQRYSRVKASLYFHSTQEGYRWKVDDPVACLDNYRGLINDPVYQDTSLL